MSVTSTELQIKEKKIHLAIMSQYWSVAANSCSLTRFKKRLDGQKHRDALCMKKDYFRVVVCWVAMTINCAPIKLISQFPECCYGSFGCTLASIHASTLTHIFKMGYFWNICMCADHSLYGKVLHYEISGREHENLDTKSLVRRRPNG